jgi:hypothetical protein
MEVLEETRHVGQSGQAVCVEVTVSHLQHVVLDCPVNKKWITSQEWSDWILLEYLHLPTDDLRLFDDLFLTETFSYLTNSLVLTGNLFLLFWLPPLPHGLSTFFLTPPTWKSYTPIWWNPPFTFSHMKSSFSLYLMASSPFSSSFSYLHNC